MDLQGHFAVSRRDIELLAEREPDSRILQIVRWFNAESISPTVLNFALDTWWTDGSYLDRQTPHQTVNMFKRAGFVSDTPKTTVKSGWYRLYRGGFRPADNGVAWSTDPDVAAWFAYRPVQRRIEKVDASTLPLPLSELVVANAPSRAILGIFANRGESEVVVDPALLTEIAHVPIDDPIIPHLHLMRSKYAQRRRLKIWLVEGAPDGELSPTAIERGIQVFTRDLHILDRQVDRNIWQTERFDREEYFLPT